MEMGRTLTILCLMAGLIPAWSSRNSRSAEEDLAHLASCSDSASVNDFCNNNRGICVEPENSDSCTKHGSGQNSGKRSNAPCKLKCQPGEPCIELPDVPNGEAVLVERNYSSLSALAIIECDRGFEIEGTVLIKCTRYQNWTEPSDQCQPIVCNPLPLVANGQYVNQTGNTVDSTATLICDEGYEAGGDPNITCQLSSCWSEVNATCKPITCENLPNVDNGEAVLLEAGKNSFEDLAQIECDYGFKINGTVLIICKSDKTWSTPDKQCQAIECGDLPMVVNGNFQSSDSLVDTEATLNCDTGYEASGNTTITCQLSSCWSTVQATCEPIVCTSLPSVSNGEAELLEAGKDSFGDLAQIVCDCGFEINGTVLITCKSDKTWSTPDKQCQAIECGDLPMVVNGNFQSSDSLVDTEATLNCDTGYEASGNTTITCQLSSCWSTVQATCEPIGCGDLPIVVNGNFQSSDSLVDTEATLNCDTGYEASGNTTITCQLSSCWSTVQATCEPIECGDLPIVVNGNFQSSDSLVDTEATLNCDTGYEASGNTTITCQLTSCWSTVQATCEPIVCASLPNVGNGDAELLKAGEGSFGDMAQIVCDYGFEINGTVLITCKSDKTWSTTDKQCQAIECGDLPMVVNGNFQSSDSLVDTEATLNCDTGYEASGNTNITCQLSSCWSKVQATCEPIVCASLPNVGNGDAELLEAGQDSFGDFAQIVCDYGFEISGTVLIKCKSDKMWSTPDKQCQAIECGDLPMVVNGNFQSSDSLVDTEATLNCDTGYEAFGDIKITCQSSSCWSNVQATCEPISCGSLPNVGNGDAELLEDGKDFFGDLAQIVCDYGFKTNRTVLITCKSDKAWSSPDMECQAIECGDLPLVENGNFQCSDNLVDAEATLECDEGYEASGDTTVTCQLSSCWSTVQATCEPISCGSPLPMIPNGQMQLVIPTDAALGDQAVAVCDKDYFPSQHVIVSVCQIDGNWSAPFGACEKMFCDNADLPTVANGVYVPLSDSSYKTVAVLDCEQGFMTSGTGLVFCGCDSIWVSESVSTCVSEI